MLALSSVLAAPDLAAMPDQFGYDWKPLAVGGGGFMMSTSSDLAGQTQVARTDTYGAYVWSDNRWQQLVNAASMPADDVGPELSAAGVQEIVVAPSSGQRLYMSFQEGVYRSDNRGSKWLRTGFAPVPMGANDRWRNAGPRLAVDPRNADVVLVGTANDGLFRSANAGAAWQVASGVPKAIDEIPFDPNNPRATRSAGVLIWIDRAGAASGGVTQGLLASSAGNGFYQSSDGGVTWRSIGGPAKALHGEYGADGSFFVASGAGGLWRLAGGVWKQLSIGAAPVTVTVDPRNPDRIFAFDDSGAPFRSVNARAAEPLLERLTRTQSSGAGDPRWLALLDHGYFTTGQVSFDPVKPGRLWVSHGVGIWYADMGDTADTSVDWITQTRGIEQLVAQDVIAPPRGSAILAGWDFGLRSKSKSTLDAFSRNHGPTNRFNSTWQVGWSGGNPSFLVQNTSDHRFCCAADGLAIQAGWSADKGRTWTRFASIPVPREEDPSNPWAFGFGSIAVSANDVNNIVWLPTFDNAPHVTRDRGASWTRIALPGEVADRPGSHFGYFLNRTVMAADRVLPSTFYFAHSGSGAEGVSKGLWRSTDGGSNWVRVFNAEIAAFSAFNAKLETVPGQAGHLFFTTGTLEGTSTALRRSVDGGATWSDVAGMTAAFAVGFGKAAAGAAYPAIYTAATYNGVYGIWRSTDNAVSWKQVGLWPGNSLDAVKAIDGDKEVFGLVYIGLGGSGWVYGAPVGTALP